MAGKRRRWGGTYGRRLGPELLPLIDPTANVTELVKLTERRLDDMRNNDRTWRDRLDAQTEKWREKLDVERIRAERAEKERLDALLAANTSNVALALEKQSAEAREQARRLGIVEQNQYGVGAVGASRSDTRTQSYYDRSLIVAIMGIVAGAIAAYLALRH